MDGYKSKIQLNTAYKRLISVLRHTYAQSKGIKEIPCNQKQKESHDSHTDSRQSRLKAKNGDIFNEGYYLIIKGSIHQEDIRVKNIQAPNIRAPKYIKQIYTDLKKKTNNRRGLQYLTFNNGQIMQI